MTSLGLPDDFYSTYWQRAPFWAPSCVNSVTGLAPTVEQLWQWANASENARLVLPDEGYRVVLDPQNPPTHRHTVLVSGAERHDPAFADWARALPELGSWRFSDLMISHATSGAGVGAHRDRYDVFLIQLRGQREWQVGTIGDRLLPESHDSGSALLQGFQPTFTVTARAGDLLYVPPGCGHMGRALTDDCMTLSVGFRMPSVLSIIDRLAELGDLALPGDPNRTQPPAGTLNGLDLKASLQAWIEATPLETLEQAFALAATEQGQPGEPLDAIEPDEIYQFAPGVRSVWHDGICYVQGEAFDTLTQSELDALNQLTGVATQGLNADAMATLTEFAEEGWLCLKSPKAVG